MHKEGWKGSVTVFFSLTCMLFLAVICTVVESARVQGAKAQTANILGMGNVSLLGEFERELLERYEIFALDGSYGSGKFQTKKIQEQLEQYLFLNTNPGMEGLSGLCFDPWNLNLTETAIESYALLTDSKGEPFYQQAVSFMKENMGVLAVEELLEYQETVSEIKEYEKNYEISQRHNDGTMANLEGQKQEKIESLESEAEAQSIQGEVTVDLPAQEQINPLEEIAKLRKKSVLELVTWGNRISQKKLTVRTLPSKSSLRKGTLKLKKEHRGTLANVLFREYLIRYFSCYLQQKEQDALEYQIEYLLGGKKSDRENLNYVVNRLLLLRAGMNYLYCVSNGQISSQANTLAASLTGFLGIPALTAATGQAIMLAWAYGESLVDVRILLDGGKVPLYKSAGTWMLSLENLEQLAEILKQGGSGKEEGMTYEGYLRILLHMGNLSKQKMRALDLIQTEIQKAGNLPEFQVQNCVVGVKSSARWNCGSVFLRLPAVTMGLGTGNMVFVQEGSMAY